MLLVLGALLIPTALAVTVVSWGNRPDPPILSKPPRADQIPPPILEPVDVPVAHVNSSGYYAFTYPPRWNVEEVESFTRVESPSGDIVVSFGLGSPGDIGAASGRLLSSILDAEGVDPPPNQGLTGRTWERIDGSRSLIVSGLTKDPTGRAIRFLAITVRATPRNYSISVLVPARSNPTRVLPTIEAIVSSFEILEREPDVVI